MSNAIGIVEFNSIAKGMYATDQMIKTAEIDVITANTVCPGKYIAIVHGDVSSVANSVEVGVAEAEEFLVDHMVIPNVHAQVFPAIAGVEMPESIDAIGIIETFSVANMVEVADAVLKAANLEAIEIRLGTGLGGKSVFTFTGDVGAVEAGLETGRMIAEENGTLVNSESIPSPAKDLIATLF